ncbi:hypothetical protein ACQ33O_09915 [Ferruginibacter sp. SUN002]|uniref:hypothetical protein n=1 Tax=Ferruginibacter sp. SUN002 TaxID=2937789 RepID=UPI003D363624
MIKRSLLVAFLFCGIYGIVISIFRPSSNAGFLQQYMLMNQITAEKFLYDSSKDDRCIVGTSLSNNITIDSLPGFYNLSLRGRGIQDCFYLLEKRKNKPKLLLVEMNFALRAPVITELNDLFNSPYARLKNEIPAFRAEYQPIGLFKSAITLQKPAERFYFPHYDDVVFKYALNRHKEEFTNLPDSAFISNQFINIKKQINALVKSGSDVVFFEMPIDERLSSLPYQLIVRKLFKEYFPENQYNYIPLPTGSAFETSDGIHLTKASSQQYTHYMKDWLRKKNYY